MKKSYGPLQRKHDTDSPLSNNLHFIQLVLETLFVCGVSVFAHFSHSIACTCTVWLFVTACFSDATAPLK